MSIPVKTVISINPGVIDSGSSDITLTTLTLTENPLMPFGALKTFANQTAVATFFGSTSDEASVAGKYFGGFAGSTAKPASMTFAAYASAAVAAWLQSGSLLGMPLTTLQGFSGTLTLTIDGVMETSAAIDLSTATSFSNAAALIAAGFTGKTKIPVVTWNALQGAFRFTSPSTGAASTMSVGSGPLATDLALTSDTGATTSIGVVADTPQTAMDRVTAIGENFATITTMFEFSSQEKDEFAIWCNEQNQQYQGVVFDTDAQAIVDGSTTCFGYRANAAAYNGIICITGDPNYAAVNGLSLLALVREAAFFYAGYVASVNYNQTNGNATAAFRSQSGLNPSIVDASVMQIAKANGYSAVGQFANRTNVISNKFYDGAVPGVWRWANNYLNQIQMSNSFANDLWTLIITLLAISYDNDGYTKIRNALTAGTIQSSLNFGSIKGGVVLSASEIEAVNSAAGTQIDSIIAAQGWYLQILDPGPDARANRQTPIINFWYTDGGAIQQITLNSFDIL